MKRRNYIILVILTFLLLLISAERILRGLRGLPPQDYIPEQFAHYYEDIYKRFFIPVKLPDGTVIYRTTRKYASFTEFPVLKEKDTLRIFIVGGSAAQKIDEDILVQVLEKQNSTVHFQIINCGVSGYDSYRVSLVQKEILNYNPDVIVVISGNNEFYNPVYINLWAWRLNRLMRRFWTYRIFQQAFFKNQPLRPAPIFKERRWLNFKKSLKIMISQAQKRNIPLVVCTLPVNFSGCPPRVNFPPWGNKEYFFAWKAYEEGNFNEAIKRFKEFLSSFPEEPFGHYFLGKCYEAVEDCRQAKNSYLKALEMDDDFGSDRCTPQRNNIIRQSCLQEGIILVDLERVFSKVAPHGLLGWRFFHDSCHWWDDYDFLIYKEIAQGICEVSKCNFSLLEEENSSKVLFFNNGQKSFRIALRSIAELFPIDFSNYSSVFFSERMLAFLQEAYQLDPDLFVDINSFKKRFFKELSECSWMKGVSLDSELYWPIILSHIGEVYRRLNMDSEAIYCFNQSIRLNPSLWFSYLGCGLSNYKMGFKERAFSDFREAEKKSDYCPLVSFYQESYEQK